MKISKQDRFSFPVLLIFFGISVCVFILCVCLGSVMVPLGDTLAVIRNAIARAPQPELSAVPIILNVRLPRVLCVFLTGASLAICGAAMQGLLRNSLADGSTLGVSTGASLGAALAIVFGFNVPSLPFAGTMIMAIIFAFLSLMIILTLAYRLDYSLSTNTIILLGVIFSMFVSSILSLVITFASDKVKNIVFWTMGSLSGSSYANAIVLFVVLMICGTVLMSLSRELNAFAIGEEEARHIGVPIRRVKLMVLITVSVLIGVCVSIGGSIGFVGLVTPHMVRLITGPNHKKLMVACLFGGGTFLMLCDLTARMLLRPVELPLGVVTSLIGAVVFVFMYANSREVKR